MKISLSFSLFSGWFSNETPRNPRKRPRPFVFTTVDAAGDRSGNTRTRTESSRRSLPLRRIRFSRELLELDEYASGCFDFLTVDLQIQPSDRCGFGICCSPHRDLPSGRWRSRLDPPVAGNRHSRRWVLISDDGFELSGCSGCIFLFVGCCWDFGLNDGLMKLDEGWLLGSLGGEGSVSAGGDGRCCGLKGGLGGLSDNGRVVKTFRS